MIDFRALTDFAHDPTRLDRLEGMMEILAEKRAQSKREYKRWCAAEADLRRRFKEIARRMKSERRNAPRN